MAAAKLFPPMAFIHDPPAGRAITTSFSRCFEPGPSPGTLQTASLHNPYRSVDIPNEGPSPGGIRLRRRSQRRPRQAPGLRLVPFQRWEVPHRPARGRGGPPPPETVLLLSLPRLIVIRPHPRVLTRCAIDIVLRRENATRSGVSEQGMADAGGPSQLPEGPAAGVFAALRAFNHAALLPDDYLEMINPLWSHARACAGRWTESNPRPTNAGDRGGCAPGLRSGPTRPSVTCAFGHSTQRPRAPLAGVLAHLRARPAPDGLHLDHAEAW